MCLQLKSSLCQRKLNLGVDEEEAEAVEGAVVVLLLSQVVWMLLLGHLLRNRLDLTKLLFLRPGFRLVLLMRQSQRRDESLCQKECLWVALSAIMTRLDAPLAGQRLV